MSLTMIDMQGHALELLDESQEYSRAARV
ncbi:hypothetical protein A2U01_0081468, partial [Trifolium medium]|nr:hypothetical protein [Trifolium medium]